MKGLINNIKISTKLFIENIGFSSVVSIAILYIVLSIQTTIELALNKVN